jgi:hypothetical protein
MRRKLAFGSAAAVVAALAISNPLVADAARLIGGEDIRNGSIESRDIKNSTIKSKDVAKDTLKSWDLADGAVQGKDVKNGSLTAADFQAGELPVTAYARVNAPTAALDSERTKNVASVSRTAPGIYCLELGAGVDRSVPVLASAEGGNATQSAQWSGNCGANGVEVKTEKLSVTGTALDHQPANDVSFSVLVP